MAAPSARRHCDVPDIQVEFIEEDDPHINFFGVKGVGELAMVGASAAIALRCLPRYTASVSVTYRLHRTSCYRGSDGDH